MEKHHPETAIASAAILAALRFAARKHRDQRRKDADASPYINHPIEVAHLLVETGGVSDSSVIQAAILHDTIEDTETSREEIEARFGARVAGLVLEVTDDKSLPRGERKQRQIDHAAALSLGAKQIKLADKICNVRDVQASPPATWSDERCREYIAWAARVVDRLRGANTALEAAFDDALTSDSWGREADAGGRMRSRGEI